MNAMTPNRPKALLVDDDPVVLRLLATALLSRGFEVRAATSAESGLELLLDELLELDVLVADRDLPGRDGAALVRLVRDAGGERDLGVVLLAGRDAADRERLLALGADAVLDRSAGPDDAADAIASLVAERCASPRRWLDAAAPALRGALLVVRSALEPPRRLAASPA
jgi:CheY-like chemotaxis protein